MARLVTLDGCDKIQLMDLQANIAAIQDRIRVACEKAGRDPMSVKLMAVSKGQPPQMVEQAAESGLTLFEENKVQEAKAKIGMCPGKLHWHLIGHLQTNKCRDAVHFFEQIQSVDSLHLAMEINKAAEKAGKRMPVLLEVNAAGESTKFGYKPESLLAEFLQINELSHLEVHGLMTIAPWSLEPEKVRPHFRKLRELKNQCEQLLGAPLLELSMGMSGDYEVAIEEGSTLVRIGTAIFGARSTPQKSI
jgi:pyridoxal phosphate enzyme (YggS family)